MFEIFRKCHLYSEAVWRINLRSGAYILHRTRLIVSSWKRRRIQNSERGSVCTYTMLERASQHFFSGQTKQEAIDDRIYSQNGHEKWFFFLRFIHSQGNGVYQYGRRTFLCIHHSFTNRTYTAQSTDIINLKMLFKKTDIIITTIRTAVQR